MVSFKINYWSLLRLLGLLNLPVFLLGTLGYLFLDSAIEAVLLRTSLPMLCVVISGTLLVKLLIEAPPTRIQFNKSAKTLTYTRLFRAQKVVLKYKRVRGEFTVRSGGRAGPIRGWSLSQNSQELLFVAFRASGWTEAKLQAVHEYLLHAS